VATFLLIPGGGSDPSYWRFVVAQLSARGHRGIAIDLPCEDDSADLSAYADAVVAQHPGDDGRPIVVAHSFGGFTGPLACPRVDAAALVYVSAMIPRPGECADDWWAATGCAEAQQAAARAGGWDPDDMDAVFYDGVDPTIVAEEVERVQSESRPGRRGRDLGYPTCPRPSSCCATTDSSPSRSRGRWWPTGSASSPWSPPAGTWRCCRIRSNSSITCWAPCSPPADPSSP
jgi:pimeloyl-ACP methyl ester carboxylesterase